MELATFELPKGYELLKSKVKEGETVDGGPVRIILAVRASDGEHVTWEYNDRSKCYWGHYYRSKCYWGHYYRSLEAAERDFETRNPDYTKAIRDAKAIYEEMKALYAAGNENPEDYLVVAKKYANLVTKYGSCRDGLHTEWTIPGTTFLSSRNTPTYTSYKSFTRLPDFLIFAEDCAMMVYRLNGGEGFTTPELVKFLDSRPKFLGE